MHQRPAICRHAVASIVLLFSAALPTAEATSALPVTATPAWECFRIVDPGASSDAPPLAAPLEDCRIRPRATLACSSAGLGSTAPARTGDEIVHDQLCYRVRCDRDVDAGVAEAISDAYGARVLHRGEAVFVCTPAEFAFPAGSALGTSNSTSAADGIDRVADVVSAAAICGDFSGNGTINAADALGALRTAIGSATCLPCVCDTDKNGATTAADALRILRKAVGQSVDLNCQAEGSPVAWTGTGDGHSWHDPANWSTATRIPNLCEAVTISTPDINVLHTQGDSGALSVTSVSSLQLDGGTLRVRDTASIAGTFLLHAGTLKDATVVAPPALATQQQALPPAAAKVIVATGHGGLLDGVTLEDGIDMMTGSSQVRVRNGLTLHGSVEMAVHSNFRFQDGAQILGGDGEIVFTSALSYLSVDSGASLTIGPDITVRGTVGSVGSTGMLTIDGTVDSDAPGTITITSTEGWTNNGLVQATNGGDLTLSGPWTNAGTIHVEDAGTLSLEGSWTNAGDVTSDHSTVNLGGTFSLAALGDFERNGGEVNLTGVFQNTSGLDLDATTGSWNLRGGTINGGSVTANGGAMLVATGYGGLLDGVTLEDGIDMMTGSSQVRVRNGLTLLAPVEMGVHSTFRFQEGAQALDGDGEIVFTSAASYITLDSGASLTIGPDITVRGAAGSVGANGMLTIDGTVDSDAPGTITITSIEGWTNNGTLKASAGDLALSGVGTNAGRIEVGAGQQVAAQSGFTQGGAGTLAIDIGGLASFGKVTVTGAATLSGTLDVNLTNGFDPAIGATFQVLTFTSRVGDFSSVTGLAIGGGKKFSRTLTANAMVLEVVAQ